MKCVGVCVSAEDFMSSMFGELDAGLSDEEPVVAVRKHRRKSKGVTSRSVLNKSRSSRAGTFTVADTDGDVAMGNEADDFVPDNHDHGSPNSGAGGDAGAGASASTPAAAKRSRRDAKARLFANAAKPTIAVAPSKARELAAQRAQAEREAAIAATTRASNGGAAPDGELELVGDLQGGWADVANSDATAGAADVPVRAWAGCSCDSASCCSPNAECRAHAFYVCVCVFVACRSRRSCLSRTASFASTGSMPTRTRTTSPARCTCSAKCWSTSQTPSPAAASPCAASNV